MGGKVENWIADKLGLKGMDTVVDLSRYNNGANTISGPISVNKEMAEGIQDETNTNLGTNLVQNEKPLWQQQQELLWQREDEKQKHVEEREDTAPERFIESLRRSGVNPNLYNGGQAASGGGITNATQADYSMDIAEYNKTYEMLMQKIELNYKGDQAEKDRIAGLIKSLIQGGALLGGVALKSSK